jgi:hypothetical protein
MIKYNNTKDALTHNKNKSNIHASNNRRTLGAAFSLPRSYKRDDFFGLVAKGPLSLVD